MIAQNLGMLDQTVSSLNAVTALGSTFDTSYGDINTSLIALFLIDENHVFLVWNDRLDGATLYRAYAQIFQVNKTTGDINSLGNHFEISTAAGNITALDIAKIDDNNAIFFYDNANDPYLQLISYDKTTGSISKNGSHLLINSVTAAYLSVNVIDSSNVFLVFSENSAGKCVLANIDTALGTISIATSSEITFANERISGINSFQMSDHMVVIATLGNVVSGNREAYLFSYDTNASTITNQDSILIKSSTSGIISSSCKLTETKILTVYRKFSRILEVNPTLETLSLPGLEVEVYIGNASWQWGPSVSSLDNGNSVGICYIGDGGTPNHNYAKELKTSGLTPTIEPNKITFDTLTQINFNTSVAIDNNTFINFWISDRSTNNNLLGRIFSIV